LWDIEATIDPFTRLEDVPLDYWKILIVDTFDQGGQHRERNNQPFALVAAGSSWSLVASHEALEMLVDPSGNRTIAGASPVDAQGRVEFLVEVCDPCQGDQFAYTVNDVLVSDFYTQLYFDPIAVQGARYSFTGAISRPHQVLDGGYLTWREPTSGHWFQKHAAQKTFEIKDLGLIQPGANSIRSVVDRRTAAMQALSGLGAECASMQRLQRQRAASDKAMATRAGDLWMQLKDHGVK
jgi:hypothetical protein